eukprot:Lithocolla_globosa_v1_NODE_8865_length_774_cov_61.956885.p1 type:complete len:131 gc:universal NODE_8865_length_774_cov_61.956885:685-293(-)
MFRSFARLSRLVPNELKYSIGDVFFHKKLKFVGVVTGYDVECSADDVWIEQMGVNRLKKGRHQPFYYCHSADEVIRYVAQENMIYKGNLPEDETYKMVMEGKFPPKLKTEEEAPFSFGTAVGGIYSETET